MLGDRLELMDRADRNKVAQSISMKGWTTRGWPITFPPIFGQAARGGRDGPRAAADLRPAVVPGGHMTPIWFGSAINSFGVQELMQGISTYGPPPQPQNSAEREISRTRTP
ncbi:hypothetical protein FLP41_10235 [Paracoccus marcusii]|uniref:hypothetical protein n=1 Tax=Paracoccus marcusii TaxID=59779 RepID=UPI002ED0B260|nr:hypothetical protein FLP41_10235 [Paracoccus marcusii]